jgi:hypothetical protein
VSSKWAGCLWNWESLDSGCYGEQLFMIFLLIYHCLFSWNKCSTGVILSSIMEEDRKPEVKDQVQQVSLKLRDHTGAEIGKTYLV